MSGPKYTVWPNTINLYSTYTLSTIRAAPIVGMDRISGSRSAENSRLAESGVFNGFRA